MNYKTIDKSFNSFITSIQSFFTKESNKILFQQRNTIKIVEFKQKEYVVKSFKTPHLLNQIVYRFFRDSKAQRSYVNALKLTNLKINTPHPIGYIEFPSTFLFKESYYISGFFNYDFEIREVFLNKQFKNRENILKRFIEFSYNLHQQNVYHIDYSPGNILVKTINNEYIFSIIDLNRMKFIPMNSRLSMKSLSKLTKEVDDNEFMVKYYAQISNLNEETLLETFNTSLQEEKKYLKRKKKLKKFIQGFK